MSIYSDLSCEIIYQRILKMSNIIQADKFHGICTYDLKKIKIVKLKKTVAN